MDTLVENRPAHFYLVMTTQCLMATVLITGNWRREVDYLMSLSHRQTARFRARRVAVLIAALDDQERLTMSIMSLDKEPPLTVVVVDDGSRTPLTIEDTGKSHEYVLLRLEENVGLTQALNHGLRYIIAQNFEYVLRLDAGDLVAPGRVEKQVQFLEKHNKYAAVGGQAIYLATTGEVRAGEIYPTDYNTLRRLMHTKSCFIHPTLAFRVSTLVEIGLYSDRYTTAQDYDLMFRLSRSHRVANLPDVLITYVDNTSGISVQRRRSQVTNRLLIMLRNFDPLEPLSYLGVLKTLPLLVLPRSAVEAVKARLPSRRGWL